MKRSGEEMTAVVTIKECDRCRETLRVVAEADDREVAYDLRNGLLHVCFDIPEDANLLVLDDDD